MIENKTILVNLIANQEIHSSYGGVVPELASRAHQQNIIPTCVEALKKVDLDLKDMHAIAFTIGPGLLGSLLVGSSFAKGLALGLNLPLIEVNHMQAHILAHLIDDNEERPEFPFICLTVSGGHTQIVKVHSPHQMEILGETIDDAAGEAFDKAAKMLGLPYPGGPLIDQLAKEGNPEAFQFKAGKVNHYNFSFSGLKTNILYFLKAQLKNDKAFIENNLKDLCASIQKTICDNLMQKVIKAAQAHHINQIAIAGGVSANSELRNRFIQLRSKGYRTFIPKFEYCTDNAAMIAITAHYKYLAQDFGALNNTPQPRLTL